MRSNNNQIDISGLGVVEDDGGGVSNGRLHHHVLVADFVPSHIRQTLLDPVHDIRIGKRGGFYSVRGRIDRLFHGVKKGDLRPVGQGQLLGVPNRKRGGVRKVDGGEDVAHCSGRRVPVGCPNGEHGTGGRAHDLLRDAPNQEPAEPSLAVRTHDDEIDRLVVSVTDNRFGWGCAVSLLLVNRH